MSDSSSSGPTDPDDGERRDSGSSPPQQPSEQPYGQPQQPYDQGQYEGGRYDQPSYDQPGHEQPGYDQSGYGYQQGGYYGGYQPVPEHPQSTMALTLGLIGLIGTLLCVVPSVVGPFAWFIGAKAKREIDASGGRLGGRGQALTGYVLGIITTVLLVLIVLIVGALVVLAVTIGFEDPDRLQY